MIKIPSCILLLAIFAMSVAACAAADPRSIRASANQSAPAALDALNVVWNTPSENAAGSMPLGNGEVVVNAWVEKKTGDLLLLLARTDSLSETCRFLKLGRLRVHLDGGPWANAADFRQELRLREGVMAVSGGGVKLNVFVDSAAHVLHITGESATPLAATATLECWRNKEESITDNSSWTTHGAPFRRTESADIFLPSTNNVVTWYHRNEHSVVPQLLETQSLTGVAGAFDPLLHRTFGGQLTGKGFVTDGDRSLKTAAPQSHIDLCLVTHTAQTATVDEWKSGLALQAAKSTDAAQAMARTQAWWAQFWGRSWVFVKESAAIPVNQHSLRVGVDSNGQSHFPGELEPQPVQATAYTPAQVAQAFAAGRAETKTKFEPAMPKDNSGYTFMAWIKPSSLSAGRIFDKVTTGGSDGFLFDTHPGNALRFIVGSQILQTPACLKTDQWQHVAATLDGTGSMAIYLDGKQIASNAKQNSAISRGYALQRYAQGFQGRGAYPIKFNGGFFYAEDAHPDWRNWGDCYWWQNTRHMYHPMLACGDYDLMPPLFKMYEDARLLAESRTAKYHNAQGAYFPETMTLFGTYGGDYAWNRRGKQPKDVDCPWWQYAWNQGPELVSLMLDEWDYTRDESILKKNTLPMAESVMRYFDTRFKRDAQGKIVLNPAQSVETYWHGVTNDAPTVAGLVNLTRRLTALPPQYTTPEQREFFSRMLTSCPPIPTETQNGVRKLSPAEKYNPGRNNCENPELYAIWPYREVSLSRPELLEEGKAAYARRGAHLPVGWGYDGNAAALLGLTDEAARILQIKCANSNGGYRWPATWGPNWDGLPDQNHGGNLLEIANLMLLQGESGGKILLLPAWPQKWDVDFKLHAPDNTTVSCTLQGGKIVHWDVAPDSRRKDVVLPGWAK